MKKLIKIMTVCICMVICGCTYSAEKYSIDDVSTSPLTITALRAGKADAFILQNEAGTVVIDTASADESDTLLDALEQNHITAVDVLIISHFDQDHVGGAADLINTLDVKNIYTTYQTKESEEIDAFQAAVSSHDKTVDVVKSQLTFSIGSAAYTIYPPERDDYESDDSNNSSLAVKVQNAGKSMLFCGDALEERIEELCREEDIQADIIKIPHHGTKISNLARLLDLVNPSYALITSSKSNKESDETMDLLEERNIETYLTRKGDITIVLQENDILIAQE